MHSTRDRIDSRRFSKAVGNQNFGALTHEGAELSEIFSQDIRKSRIRWWIAWLVINIALCVYILVLNILYKDAWIVDCIRTLNIWLLVYNVI